MTKVAENVVALEQAEVESPKEPESKKRKRAATDIMARVETIIAGGKEYQLTHQTMFQSREWRKELADMIRVTVPRLTILGAEGSMGAFVENIACSFEETPEAVFDLLVKYDSKLNWGEIEKTIYPDEFDTMFTQVIEAVFPLAQSLGKAAGLNLGALGTSSNV